MTLRILHWASRCFLSGLFLYSGYAKMQSTLQFAVAISGYQLVPQPMVLPLATWLPWVEVALGAVLLTGWRIQVVSIAATGLLGVFIIVQGVTYLRGIEADCGCFGAGEKISPLTIAVVMKRAATEELIESPQH